MKLAEAYAARGDRAGAIGVLEDAGAQHAHAGAEPLLWGYAWPPGRERLAQLHRLEGRVDDAARVEKELRARLAVADDDHPIKRRLSQIEP